MFCCWFVCVSDSALLTTKQHSVSADCVFAADFDVASDFASSPTGQKSPELTDVKSQDDSKQLYVSTKAQVCDFVAILFMLRLPYVLY